MDDITFEYEGETHALEEHPPRDGADKVLSVETATVYAEALLFADDSYRVVVTMNALPQEQEDRREIEAQIEEQLQERGLTERNQ